MASDTAKPLHRIFDSANDKPPKELAGSLTAAFSHREAGPQAPILKTYKEILSYFDLPQDHPIARAGELIANAMEKSDEYGGKANGYHNLNHTLEVMMSAATLLAIHEQKQLQPELSKEMKLLLITSALSHDLGHNGKGNGMANDRVPLLTENHSMHLARSRFVKAYGGETDEFKKTFWRFSAILAATDIGGGDASPAEFFAGWAKYHRGEYLVPPETNLQELQPYLKIAEEPVIAELCTIMQDADLLPSIGLTPNWAEKQGHRLAEEEPFRLTQEGDLNWSGTLWFYNNLAKFKSQAGTHFAPNLLDIIDHAKEREHIQAEAGKKVAQRILNKDRTK